MFKLKAREIIRLVRIKDNDLAGDTPNSRVGPVSTVDAQLFNSVARACIIFNEMFLVNKFTVLSC